MMRAVMLLSVAVTGWALAGDANTLQPAATTDWPNWRGPNQNGISTEKGWLTAWPKEGLKQLWKADVGSGYSSVAVLGDNVYTLGNTKGQDTVICLNAATGEAVWKHTYPCTAKVIYGVTPRATPAVDGKAVYTMSVDGQVLCLDATSGKPIWSKDLQKDFNLPLPKSGFAGSPIVEGDMLLVNAGVSGLALDKKTGRTVWKSEGDTSYSSPVPFTLAGRRCVALFAATQLAVLNLADGVKIASYDWKTETCCNCSDPVIAGENIFITSSYGQGCALVGVGGGNATLIWKKKFACHYADPVLVGDCLYALFETGWLKADLVCLNLKDGVEKWRQKNVGSGGIMVADGKLLILSRTGDLILAEASPTAYTELARTKVFPEQIVAGKTNSVICWTSPVLCNGRIYARGDQGTLVCLDAQGKKH